MLLGQFPGFLLSNSLHMGTDFMYQGCISTALMQLYAYVMTRTKQRMTNAEQRVDQPH